MDVIKALNKIRTELVSDRDLVRNELRNYPNASLMIAKDHDYLQKYMVSPDGTRTRIGRNPNLIHKLARRAFLIVQIRQMDINLALLDQTIKTLRAKIL